MKLKEESEKAVLKLNIQKTKIMASGPISSWQIDGETGETVSDFILGGSKITADGDCNHEIKSIYVSILLQIISPFRLLQGIEQCSLCYTVGPGCRSLP